LPPNNPAEEVFRHLYGQPCWNVKSGYGSFMTMEFGTPSLHIREPRAVSDSASPAVAKNAARRIVTLHGEWHLWIYSCAWQVFTAGKRIGHSNLKGSSKQPIKRAADELDGQKLIHVSVNPRTANTVFEFDLGSRLETKPYNETSDQWILFEPNGNIFTLRGNGDCSHESDDTDPEDTIWMPLPL
jgi:hypothetical protein